MILNQERHFGPEHPGTAVAMVNLAAARAHIGDYSSQRQLLLQALQIKEREFGKDHANNVVAMRSLAENYGRLGHYQLQKNLLERVLSIVARAFGYEHLEVASTLSLGSP